MQFLIKHQKEVFEEAVLQLFHRCVFTTQLHIREPATRNQAKEGGEVHVKEKIRKTMSWLEVLTLKLLYMKYCDSI